MDKFIKQPLAYMMLNDDGVIRDFAYQIGNIEKLGMALESQHVK